MKKTFLISAICLCVLTFLVVSVSAQTQFQVLATKKTSTAEKEMNQAAAEGFRFEGVSGGETSVGGSEVVVVMSKQSGDNANRYQYRLLATKRTGTMQKELNEAGAEGFAYRGQTVFNTTFGGQEVVVILEKDTSIVNQKFQYKLLATSKTSTMQKELNDAGSSGFKYVGITTGETAFGGKELVTILAQEVTQR